AADRELALVLESRFRDGGFAHERAVRGAEVDEGDALLRNLDGRMLPRDLRVLEHEVDVLAADEDPRLVDRVYAPGIRPGDDRERELEVRRQLQRRRGAIRAGRGLGPFTGPADRRFVGRRPGLQRGLSLEGARVDDLEDRPAFRAAQLLGRPAG